MHIDRLEISEFRGVKLGTVFFTARSIIIGANNAGKTTILEALALLLGRDRMVRALTEHDFYGSEPTPTDRIRIIATLSGFDQNDPVQHPDWFRASRGVVKWIRPTDGVILPESSSADDHLAVQVALDARFNAETLEVETIRYFYDSDDTGDPFDEESVTTLPSYLVRDLGFFLVPASRSWDRMMSFGSELFRRVINYMGGKPASTVIKLRDELRAPDPELQNDDNIVDVVTDINADLKAILGKDTELKLRLTRGDSASILDAIEPHFNADAGQTLPASRHGAGLISMQSLVLLLRFGHVRAQKGDPFLLAIEEPELHVPPPLQRRIAQKIQSLTSQSILTTHSPVVASHGKANDIILIRNNDGIMTSKILSPKPLTRTSNNVERRLLQTGLSETVTALMHPFLLVPEGRIDRDYLDLIASHMTAAYTTGMVDSAFGTRVGIVATPDSRMRDTLNILGDVHGQASCLVDGDAGGDAHITEVLVQPQLKAIVQLPNDWTIEHVIGWIIEADPTVLTDPELVEAGLPADPTDAVTLLSQNTNTGGMKGELVIMESLVSVLSQSRHCRNRMKLFLDALLAAMTQKGAGSPNLTVHHATTEHTPIWVFSP